MEVIAQASINRAKFRACLNERNKLIIQMLPDGGYDDEWINCRLSPILIKPAAIDEFIAYIQQIKVVRKILSSELVAGKYKYRIFAPTNLQINLFSPNVGGWESCNLNQVLVCDENLDQFIAILNECKTYLKKLDLL